MNFLSPFLEASKESSSNRSEEWRKKHSKIKKAYFASMTEEEKLKLLTPWIEAGVNSSPSTSNKERELSEYIQSKGYEIEMQKRIGPYYVDIFIPSKNLIIEFYGCFWHQCEKCGYNNGIRGDSANSIRNRNKERIEYLKSQGYNVGIVWEHEFQC